MPKTFRGWLNMAAFIGIYAVPAALLVMYGGCR